ncbi:hypothetical protein O6H91_20G035600 [Diphasiastrum complanatum]|uniref:Uncharacterized protein n=6 Tax=Diphasiastrum complanatum TaxID=34168 RepID=A0ACC2AQD5_DIPCM|nr:hypothetical protein O6H91_20G035600 [Diphasiastrum complanatum]KAJ7519362.1 hypothetical protein O6H91_20G035600 [Diphasiastrum complanatum]KAJ7519366.1 hypothetical protein O6H91_20G035600 [Diphasiastrum complanatum]KAJ7519368.1 hypothetical protein O6H91_20G035600 [Diphasiastrum complanatum]KAJ7519372.1 hypothetical protein O6H91_20G035600 [Diphasiastrum complanatum]
MDKSDIRKWFLKQAHSKEADTSNAVKQGVAKKGEAAIPVVEAAKLSRSTSGTSSAKSKVNEGIRSPLQTSPSPPVKRQKGVSTDNSNVAIEKPSSKRLCIESKDDVGIKSESPVKEKRKRGQASDVGQDLSSDTPLKTPAKTVGRGVPSSTEKPDNKPVSSGRGQGGYGRGGGYGYMPARVTPPHKGEKDVPEGADDALAGLTFVISGTLDSLEREEAEDLIKRHGGRVTSAVSKKTSYLLADEDVGGRKSEKAKELGVPFLTEDGLFNLIRASKKKNSAAKCVEKAVLTPRGGANVLSSPKGVKSNSIGKRTAHEAETIDRKTSRALRPSTSEKSGPAEVESWPQKHRPKSSDEIIGNQSIVKQLRDWLNLWEKHHLHSGPREGKGKKQTNGGSSTTAVKKAVLLSGPPGIGKTTTARLLSQELGYQALEVNASDSRGKSDSKVQKGIGGSTANTIKEMVSNESLSFKGTNWTTNHQKSVLIMDEVDGMSGGDRGGIADLIASIKASQVPIICICNDRYSQKLKSLINHCLPLAFRKPTKQQMAKRLQQIAQTEGLHVDEVTLEELADQSNGDMRMALNQLQYMSLRSKSLKYTDMKSRLLASRKDEDITPFTAVDKLLGYDGGRLRMDERLDATMSDPDLVPLLIEENYLNYRPSGAGRDESGTARMDLVARAAASIADGDIVNVQIRRFRQWQHAQMSAFMSSIIPAALMHGQREVLTQGERNFNRFGSWLGKNSSLNKKIRLLEDVHVHMLASRNCEPTREAVRLDYVKVLALQLTVPLRRLNKDEAVLKVVDVMDEYSLTQDDFDTILDITKFQGHANLLDGVQPATKTALTKAYKQREQDRRVRSADLLPSILPGQKKSAKKIVHVGLLESEAIDDDELIKDDAAELSGEEENGETDELEETGADLLKKAQTGFEIIVKSGEVKGARRNNGRLEATNAKSNLPKKRQNPSNTESKGGKRKK